MKRSHLHLVPLLILITLLSPTTSFSQGLFANGGFENFSSCPSSLGQITNVNGLQLCTSSSDYFNSCGLNTTCNGLAVPTTSGNGCIGMRVQPWSPTSTSYETTIAILDNPTVNGTQYNIALSLYARDVNFNTCSATGGIESCFSFGFYFYSSSNPVSCPSGPFMATGSQPAPDVFIDGSAISPLNSWVSFCLPYTADGVYDRVMFGWFPNTLTYNTTACPNNKFGYVYMDDFSIDLPGVNCNTSPCNYSVSAGSNATICQDDSLTFTTASSGGGVISTAWTTSGDGTFNNTTLLNPIYTPGVADIATGSVTLTITTDAPAGTCAAETANITLTITNFADATITALGPLCNSDSPFNLTANSTGGVWSGTGITNSVLGTFDPTTAGFGNWEIIYTVPVSCGDADTLDIIVDTIVDATIIPTGPFCSNAAPVNLTAQNTGGIWSGTGITNTSNGTFNPTISGSGTWNISYTISGVCNTTENTTITVNQVDDAQFVYDQLSYCIPSATNPLPSITGTTRGLFSITNSGVINDTTGRIDLTHSGIGNYDVTYTTSSLCPDASTETIEICEEAELLIPNIFTPNNDGSNDVFKIEGNNLSNVKAKIYNRWGVLIYSWNGVDGFWDGRTTAGKEAIEGTYYYVLNILDMNSVEILKTGSVVLMR